MSKATKIWLITAASLVLAGVTIITGVMFMLDWNFLNLNTEKYETNSYEVNDVFNNINIKTATADISFVRAEDGNCKVVCYEKEDEKHSVGVENGVLVISTDSKIINNIGINFGTSKITVYLPDSEYGDLKIEESTGDIVIPSDFGFKSVDIAISTGDVDNYASVKETLRIKASTGDILVENVSANAVDLSVTTGKITAKGIECTEDLNIKVSTGAAKMSNVTCKNLISDGTTGDTYFENVTAAEKLHAERTTGDIKISASDAKELYLKTTTGDIEGSLLSGKQFVTNSSTGDIAVPDTSSGGRCEISTTTGDIKIECK